MLVLGVSNSAVVLRRGGQAAQLDDDIKSRSMDPVCLILVPQADCKGP